MSPPELYAQGCFVMAKGDMNLRGQAYVHGSQTALEAQLLAQLWAAAPGLRAEHERQLFGLHVLAGLVNAPPFMAHPDWPDAVGIIQELMNGARAALERARLPEPEPETHQQHLRERFRAEAQQEKQADAADEARRMAEAMEEALPPAPEEESDERSTALPEAETPTPESGHEDTSGGE